MRTVMHIHAQFGRSEVDKQPLWFCSIPRILMICDNPLLPFARHGPTWAHYCFQQFLVQTRRRLETTYFLDSNKHSSVLSALTSEVLPSHTKKLCIDHWTRWGTPEYCDLTEAHPLDNLVGQPVDHKSLCSFPQVKPTCDTEKAQWVGSWNAEDSWVAVVPVHHSITIESDSCASYSRLQNRQVVKSASLCNLLHVISCQKNTDIWWWLPSWAATTIQAARYDKVLVVISPMHCMLWVQGNFRSVLLFMVW